MLVREVIIAERWAACVIVSQLGFAAADGSRNRRTGQRLMLRQGLLHFECDTTLDKNSRKREGLKGHGAGVTIIRPKGQILGVCSDYHSTKVFTP